MSHLNSKLSCPSRTIKSTEKRRVSKGDARRPLHRISTERKKILLAASSPTKISRGPEAPRVCENAQTCELPGRRVTANLIVRKERFVASFISRRTTFFILVIVSAGSVSHGQSINTSPWKERNPVRRPLSIFTCERAIKPYRGS